MIQLLRADTRQIPLASGSIHCIATSPPYFGLRKYAGVPETTWGDGWRGCLGNEPTVEGYVAHMVECFREVRRVLRDDGVCWLNLGDSYSTTPPGNVRGVGETSGLHGAATSTVYRETLMAGHGQGAQRKQNGIPSGNLLGVPWRVAFALQADGWILREDVVWSKAAPMPESVSGWRWERCRVKVASADRKRDGMGGSGRTPHGASISEPYREGSFPGRPQSNPDGKDFAPSATATDGYVLRRGSWRHTRAHESIFMLTKSMGYFCDAEAVKEAAAAASIDRDRYGLHVSKDPNALPQERRRREEGIGSCDRMGDFVSDPSGRNPRSVMHLGPAPFKGAHFSTFPPALVEPLILAATSARGCCPACGAPWARIVVRKSMEIRPSDRRAEAEAAGLGGGRTATSGTMTSPPEAHTLGWRPTCDCDAGPPAPCTVLDPFAGSGTTGRVAVAHRRRAILCDASAEYLRDLADERTRNVQVELLR